MLWGNALLTGYFAYRHGLHGREPGGGVHAFAEMDRRKLPADHPETAARDSAPMPNPNVSATPRPAPPAIALMRSPKHYRFRPCWALYRKHVAAIVYSKPPD